MDKMKSGTIRRTTYIDSGEFGKIMFVMFITMKNDDCYMVNWDGMIYCSDSSAKMSKKLSDIYYVYTKAVSENNTKTITSDMTTNSIHTLFKLVEEYIRERLFDNYSENILTIKADSVEFVDDKKTFTK